MGFIARNQGLQHFDAGGTVAPTSAFNTAAVNSGGSGVTANGPVADAVSALFEKNSYIAQTPGITTQDLSAPIQGLQNQAGGLFNQQQALAGQYGQEALGQGPNPAQAQLANTTGQNIASQGALAAGQRGASSNVGLMARQVGQQGAGIQQNAVGQAAALQAQQSLAAQAAQASLYGNMASQNLQGQSIDQGAQASQNTALNAGQLGAASINAGVAAQNANATNAAIGGVASGAGAAIGSLAGPVGTAVGKTLGDTVGSDLTSDNTVGSGAAAGAYAGGVGAFAKGGMVPGGPKSRAGRHLAQFKAGGKVPGKAQVSGNSLKNDNVTAMLSPGEIVIPRSASMDPDKAAAFARQVALKNKGHR